MSRLLTKSERTHVYTQLMGKLIDLDLWDSELESIKKLRIMATLFRDNAMEFKGELPMPHNKVISYQFYKDYRNQTNVNISKGINRNMTAKERESYYDKLLNIIEENNLHDTENAEVLMDVIENLENFKKNGKNYKKELKLSNGKKLICDVYNDYKHESVITIISSSDLLSKKERNDICDEIRTSLKKLKIWDAEHSSILEFKKVLDSYCDEAIDMVGEIRLRVDNILVYELYNDRRKKSFAKISNDSKKLDEKQDIEITQNDISENIPDLIGV